MDDKRRRSRVKAVLPVKVSGNDNSGNSYSDLVHTLDITESGARLGALRQALKVGTLITLQYKQHRGTFRVVWSEPVSSHTEHQVGLEAVNHGDLWGLGAQLRIRVPAQAGASVPAHAGA